ncbi:MAG: ACT domain-containing protein [Fidelibacterota bacterium]|nr:MAG: ACT domain-containing protein [Candidatus Neomarinimicrobiota bacterium]
MPEKDLQSGWKADTGWRGLRVAGPLSLDLTGVLASLTQPLAAAGVSIFAISTYHTDYLLVKDTDLSRAAEVLRAVGHTII